MRPARIEPGPGQESVWDYPRPPVAVPCERRIRVIHHGITLVDTSDAVRVLETSQPPAYYLPPSAITAQHLVPTSNRSLCEWKGLATYWSLTDERGRPDTLEVAWSYERPTAEFAPLAGMLAFYAQRVDECWVDDERVTPNPGTFYGGWITSHVVGPFKGAPGTLHW